MTDIIEALRGLRNQTSTFEAGMSALTVAIGNIERLTDLTPDQTDRLRAAMVRLSNAHIKHTKEAAQ